MSINLNFWKYEAGADHNHAYVYEKACSDGELVEGLERLPISKILEKIDSAFSGWTALEKNTYEKEGYSAFQIFTTPQIVRFDCYAMEGEDMNTIVDILFEFDCPLYDPETSTRYDSWTDR